MKLLDYVYSQLERVHPFPIGCDFQKPVRLKLFSEHGKTDFINITESQYKEIKNILISINDYERT